MKISLTIAKKLALLGTIAILGLAIMFGVGYSGMNTLTDLETQNEAALKVRTLTANINTARAGAASETDIAIMNYIGGKSSDDAMRNADKHFDNIFKLLGDLKAMNLAYIEPRTIEDAISSGRALHDVIQEDIFASIKARASAQQLVANNEKRLVPRKQFNENVNSIREKAFEVSEKLNDELAQGMARTRSFTLTAFLIACAVIIPLVVLIVMAIVKPIRKITGTVQSLAEGDYKVSIDSTENKDEIGDLSRGLLETRQAVANYSGQLSAIDKSQAVVEYDMKGCVITANANFLNAMGYSLDEVKGKNHAMFTDQAQSNSADYRRFWDSLCSGQYQSGEYKRIGRGGIEIWVQASYNPIYSPDGAVYKIVEYATDITKQKLQISDFIGQIDAIGKSQAVIAFDTKGTVLSANANFLQATGYSAEEIVGKHHSMFCDPAYASSAEYRAFWEALGRGQYQSAEYRRVGRGGRELWLQASYNPILDPSGRVYKVVKYASDVTQAVMARKENERGMEEAVQLLRDVSAGMLTNKMNGDYKGTFADIKKALNATIDKLTEIVVNIKSSAESVGCAANEISSGSADLSQRTEQQASNLEETAASMEEVTGAVKQNTENANNAKELAQQANNVAEQGGEVVERAVSAMGEIERSSQKIADIIGVIDEIAFQTNLLALNAAVEAARAGEAGKGFAVVAQEVRSLAGRSASASKEIKSLISESVGQVKSGAELVNQAGMTLKDIVTAVRKVTDIMTEIAAASVEQSSGIEEINNAITQMDQMTQQNAALVEENTAAAGSLVDLSSSLEEMISFFKVGEAGEAAAAQAMQQRRAVAGEKKFAGGGMRAPAAPAARTVTSLKPRTASAAPRKATGGDNVVPHQPPSNRQDNEWKEF